MDEDAVAAAKRAAGESAAATITDGDVVGLGSGSTAAHAIEALGEAVAEGVHVVGVPTSYQARELAIEHGVPLADLDEVSVDVAIDGADQLAGATAIKGGGGAHAREEVVAGDADRFLAVVDQRKVVETLSEPVPLEVLPSARRPVEAAVAEAGGEATLRRADKKSGPVVSDNGNLLVDADFGTIADPATLAETLSAVPGVFAHGLFVDVVDAVHVGQPEGSVAVRTP